ncbi:uncharacterized protein LOC143827787 [Paroedura picta]|uniref:uncharacterized protein LOC143827787 n=1 Tax=Paroedura picta TaxID=143630 RepID=UPI004055F76A
MSGKKDRQLPKADRSPKKKLKVDVTAFWRRKKDMSTAAKAKKIKEKEKELERLKRQQQDQEELEESSEEESLDMEKIARLLEKHSKEIKAYTDEALKKQSKELSKEIQDIKKELTDSIDGIKTLVEGNTKQLKEHNVKIEKLEGWRVGADDKFEILQTEVRSRNVKIRGAPESFGKEDLKKELTEAIASYLEEEEVKIEKAYRVNSRAAKRNNQPRDILVGFESKSAKNALQGKHREDPFTLEDQEVKIFQDLPPEILQKRAQFHFLRQILIGQNIRYFWKIPFALEVILPTGRRIIKTLQQAQELADTLAEGSALAEEQRKQTSQQEHKGVARKGAGTRK